MEQTPATRFVDLLGRLGYKTQQQIADLLDIARPTAGTIVRYEKPPSFKSMTALKSKHPEISMEWLLTGAGSAFVTGDAAPTPAPQPIAQEPAPTYTAPLPATPTEPLVPQLLERLAEETKQHREEMRETKREYREDLRAQATNHQNILLDMRRQIDTAIAETGRVREEKQQEIMALQRRISELELRCGMRMPTREEAERLARQEKEKQEATPIGFGRVAPQMEEACMALSYSNPSFTRPRVVEQEVSHLQAA